MAGTRGIGPRSDTHLFLDWRAAIKIGVALQNSHNKSKPQEESAKPLRPLSDGPSSIAHNCLRDRDLNH